MLSGIRRRFTYTNVALTLALVLAMTGGAYAASKYVITSTKQIKPSVLKQLKGNAGPAGTAGATGAQGAGGPQGPPGNPGANGTNGTSGESVASAALKPGDKNCGFGGSKFTVGGIETFACNGKEGAEGKEGSPWTAGGTLPSGKTETGTWAFANSAPAPIVFSEGAETSISFTIPLSERLDTAHVHVIKAGETGAGGGTCPTTSSAGNPEAEPGNLCVFVDKQTNVKEQFVLLDDPEANTIPGAGKTGAVVAAPPEEATKGFAAIGTWAVTAK